MVAVDPGEDLILPNPGSFGYSSFSPTPEASSGTTHTSPGVVMGTDRQTVITDARDTYNTSSGSSTFLILLEYICDIKMLKMEHLVALF